MAPASTVAPAKTVTARLNLFALQAIALLGLSVLYTLQNYDHFAFWNLFGLISLGIIGCWRWGLFSLRIVRSRFYIRSTFRRWRKQADAIAVEQLPPICLLVPTYKEQAWITERVFQAIVREAKTLSQPIWLLVNSSGDEENALIRQVLEAEDPEWKSIQLIQMIQKDGKRKAMADGLRELAKLDLPHDLVIALMDGDSELAPGTLRQCLPFFRLFPRMGALTTDELPIVQGSDLFLEWFHLRFAQRHYQMCSDSLSGKVMCLTGRFSLFRNEAALHPTFADQLENDNLTDWLWGKFKFLSGDDKSTWFWLLRHGYDMLYIPDAIVYSIETVSGSVVDRAYANMRRWYGNMLRNNGRAIALGPKVTGWFTWYSLFDQRISIWTSLITPGFLMVALCQGEWRTALIIIAWVVLSRSVMLMMIFHKRQSDLKPIHLGLLLVTQWSSSLVKIWTQMNLAKQKWANRGNQTIDAEGKGKKRIAKVGTSRFLLMAQIFSFVVFLLWLTGVLNPAWDLQGFVLNQQFAVQPKIEQVEAVDYGIVPSDGQDDAVALQTLIDRLSPNQLVQINLPIGEVDLFQPVKIHRSNLSLKGYGIGRTILLAHFGQSVGNAVLQMSPSSQPVHPLQISTAATISPAATVSTPLSNLELSSFTLRHLQPDTPVTANYAIDSVVLRDVNRVLVRNLQVEQSGRYPLVLEKTRDVTLEYVAVEGRSGHRDIIMTDTINTQTVGLTTLSVPVSKS
jgi:glycosyltransferase Alg8